MSKICDKHGTELIKCDHESGRQYWKCNDCAQTMKSKCPGYKAWVTKPQNVEKIQGRRKEILDYLLSKCSVEEKQLRFLLDMYAIDNSSISPAQYSTLERILGKTNSV